jgi:hypothetical protein
MERRRPWDSVAIVALMLSFCATGGYFSLMYPVAPDLRESTVNAVLLVPFTGLYCAWALWRSVTRKDLRGGWLAWIACGLLFFAVADFSRTLFG